MSKNEIAKAVLAAAILAAAKEITELVLSGGKSGQINRAKKIEAEWHDAE